MPDYQYQPAGQSFGTALLNSLAKSIVEGREARRKRGEKEEDLQSQRDFLAQQKQNYMDYMSQESRNRMAEHLLEQTKGTPSEISEAAPYVFAPEREQGLRDYLAHPPMTPGSEIGETGPQPQTLLDPERLASFQRIARTLGMPRELGAAAPKGGGREAVQIMLKEAAAEADKAARTQVLAPGMMVNDPAERQAAEAKRLATYKRAYTQAFISKYRGHFGTHPTDDVLREALGINYDPSVVGAQRSMGGGPAGIGTPLPGLTTR